MKSKLSSNAIMGIIIAVAVIVAGVIIAAMLIGSKPKETNAGVSSNVSSEESSELVSSKVESSKPVSSKEESKPESSEVASSEKEKPVASKPVSSETAKPAEWTETAASGTFYVTQNCNSRIKPIKGADVAVALKTGQEVKVTAKTSTEYYKFGENKYVHESYLSKTKPTDKPAESKPTEKPATGGTSDKPDPDGDGLINVPVLEEDSRTPKYMQSMDGVDTSLVGPSGNHHGEQDSKGLYYHVGSDSWMPAKLFIQGRWGQHPEGTSSIFEKYYTGNPYNWGSQVSIYQEHLDYNPDGNGFQWCSYCSEWIKFTEEWGKPVSFEHGYASHKTETKHYLRVKENYNSPKALW